jgi:IS605 OrfB family transposase
MNIISYNVKLITHSKEDYNLLLETLTQHQLVWNYISKQTFKSKIIDKKLIHDSNYHNCRSLFPKCPSQVIIKAKDSVYATYKTIKSNKQLANLSNPAIQSNLSLRLDKRLYTFISDNRIKLTTTVKNKRIICSYKPYDKFKELFSKYSICDPLIFMKNNELYLSVSFEVPIPTFIENKILGVDLGIKRMLVTSEGLALTDKIFLKEKRKIRYLKRYLASKKKTTNSHSSKNKLKKLKRKEHNKNKNLCHHLVNELLKTECNTIVLEDLSSLKKNKLKKENKNKRFNNKLSQVPFKVLLSIISYKAPLLGKKVVTVDPYMTSQNDHRGILRGIRKGCRYYASDKLVLDSDWNAAINIASKYVNTLSEQHPLSFNFPFDGKLNYRGRVLSTTQ